MADITTADSVYGPGSGHLNQLNVPGADGKPNPYPYGECTAYCWQYYHDTQQIDIPSTLGNATLWVDNSHRERWAVDQTPAPAKAVCWAAAKYPPFGHVAICEQLNGDGSFDVLEWNFTYYASERPDLAGKIDRRTVRNRDGISGFITPTGVRVATGAQDAGPLAALALPLTSIGDAIREAGLYFEAQAMTAQLRLVSMGQVGVGTVMAGGGLVLGSLTAAGGGSPGRGWSRARARLRPVQRQLTPRQPSPIGRRTLRPTEERWVSRQTREQLIGSRAQAKLGAGIDPRSLTDAEAAWLQRHPEAMEAALRRQNAGVDPRRAT